MRGGGGCWWSHSGGYTYSWHLARQSIILVQLAIVFTRFLLWLPGSRTQHKTYFDHIVGSPILINFSSDNQFFHTFASRTLVYQQLN